MSQLHNDELHQEFVQQDGGTIHTKNATSTYLRELFDDMI